MPSINATPKRFTAGSVVTINNGTTTWTHLNFKESGGSYKYSPGYYEPIQYKDRGVLKTPLLGDQRPGKLDLEFVYAGWQDTNDIPAFMLATSSTGNMPLFTVVTKIPSYNGSSTGEQLTYASCFLAADGIGYEEGGGGLDMLKLSLIHNEVKPTATTY